MSSPSSQRQKTIEMAHQEGLSDLNPIKIPSTVSDGVELVSSQDFEFFLQYVYDR